MAPGSPSTEAATTTILAPSARDLGSRRIVFETSVATRTAPASRAPSARTVPAWPTRSRSPRRPSSSTPLSERFYGVEVEDYGSEGGSEGGTELGEERGWCWIEDFRLVDPERFAELEAQKDDPPAFARRTGYLEFWQADQVFLTREAAEGYIKSQAHNLGRARVWTASAHRNYEWKWLRSFLPAVTGQLRELSHALRRTNSALSVSKSMLLASQRLAKGIEVQNELEASRVRVAVLEERLSQYECLICDDEIGSCDCIDPPNYDEACGECGAAAGEEKHRSNHLDTCPKCQREHSLYPSKE